MNLSSIKKNKLPDSPGVYFFIGLPKRNREGGSGFKKHTPQLGSLASKLGGRKILYIGKATSLRDRVKSYLNKDIEFVRSPWIAKMVTEVKSITFQKTDSVLEALLLEARLIKKYQPPYNTEQKDDKSYNHVIITDEEFPRVLLAREKDFVTKLQTINYKLKTSFGPFPKGGALKEALKIIRKIFPYRDTCTPFSHLEAKLPSSPGERKPCFNAQIGLCPGVCAGITSAKEYQKQIKNIILFFEGKKKKIILNLRREMRRYAKTQEFEKASEIKKQLFVLEHIQDVSLLKNSDTFRMESASSPRPFRIEAYDVAHLSGQEMIGVMAVIENGVPNRSEYRKFKIKSVNKVNDPAALREIIARRLRHSEWPLPSVIVVDGNKTQKRAAEATTAPHLEAKLPSGGRAGIHVLAVVKDEHHKPKAILGEESVVRQNKRAILLGNSEAHRFALSFHRRRREKSFINNKP